MLHHARYDHGPYSSHQHLMLIASCFHIGQLTLYIPPHLHTSTPPHHRDVRRAARVALTIAFQLGGSSSSATTSSPSLAGRLADGLVFAMNGGAGAGTLMVSRVSSLRVLPPFLLGLPHIVPSPSHPAQSTLPHLFPLPSRLMPSPMPPPPPPASRGASLWPFKPLSRPLNPPPPLVLRQLHCPHWMFPGFSSPPTTQSWSWARGGRGDRCGNI